MKGGQPVKQWTKPIKIKAVGRTITELEIEMPKQKGDYQLKASLKLNEEEVFSIRDFEI